MRSNRHATPRHPSASESPSHLPILTISVPIAFPSPPHASTALHSPPLPCRASPSMVLAFTLFSRHKAQALDKLLRAAGRELSPPALDFSPPKVRTFALAGGKTLSARER